MVYFNIRKSVRAERRLVKALRMRLSDYPNHTKDYRILQDIKRICYL